MNYHRRKSMSLRAVVLATLFTSGCYHYIDVPPVTVRPGTHARVVLTARGASDVTKYLESPFEEGVITGNVVNNTGGVISLDATVGSFPSRLMADPQHHEYLPLIPDDYYSIQVGRVDRPRTAAAVITSLGAAGLVWWAAHNTLPKTRG